MRFVKGHGTENDFVLLPDGLPGDPDGLAAETVRTVCDRRRGVGADGVLAVVRVAAPTEADPRWFMDYRNADGGLAEMCGNGIRVFARYLVDSGLEEPGDLLIGTRAGVKTVAVPSYGDITVGMGSATKLADAKVQLGERWWPAAGWSMGNPHLVVTDADLDVAAADLTTVPAVDPPDAYADGVNVELVAREEAPRHIRMRVHERGVGETRSCGTGACAAAVAVMASRGERTSYDVDVPGGRLAVEWREDGEVLLTGPAVLVYSGEYPGDAER
ncbi:MAG: diaminopimelate epimerase [Frankiaceae bacterium]|nr:diaminopimelate epimerase [Frankiaceae bacterium]